MSVDAKSIHFVKMIPMAMYPWASLATATGHAKADILAFNVVLPCWSLTKHVNDASHLQPKTVMCPLPRLLPKMNKEVKSPVALPSAHVATLLKILKTEDASRLKTVAISKPRMKDLFHSTWKIYPSSYLVGPSL
jgi:hypothetical protein